MKKITAIITSLLLSTSTWCIAGAEAKSFVLTNSQCILEPKKHQDSGYSLSSCYLEIHSARLGRLKVQLQERFIAEPETDSFWIASRHFQGHIISPKTAHLAARKIFPVLSASLIGNQLEINLYQNKELLIANRLRVNFPLKNNISRRVRYSAQNLALLYPQKTASSCGNQHNTSQNLGSLFESPKHEPAASQASMRSGQNHSRLKKSAVPLLTISTEADHEFYQFYGRKARARIQSILNTAESIYRQQLGIGFDLIEQHQQREPDQFMVSNQALTLLFQFRNLTLSEQQLGVAAAYHLFTGKALQGSTLGIHFQGFFCQNQNLNYGLSKLANSSLQAIITAHELGHGFNATHPEETLVNPPASLMSGFAASSHTNFSDFSTNEINNYLGQQQSCLSAAASSKTRITGIETTRKKGFTMAEIQVQRTSGAAQRCEYQLYASSNSQNLSGAGITSEPQAIEIKNSDKRKLSFNLKINHRRPTSPRNRIIFRVVSDCSGEIARSNIFSIKLPLASDKIEEIITNISGVDLTN